MQSARRAWDEWRELDACHGFLLALVVAQAVLAFNLNLWQPGWLFLHSPGDGAGTAPSHRHEGSAAEQARRLSDDDAFAALHAMKGAVPRLVDPTMAEVRAYVDRNHPFVLARGAGGKDTNGVFWTNTAKWSDAYLSDRCAGSSVPVRVINTTAATASSTGPVVFRREEYTKEAMFLEAFLRDYRRQADTGRELYIGQADVRMHLPCLLPDIPEPEWLAGDHTQIDSSPTMYFGAGNQATQLHFDAADNLMHVVKGTKRVLLWDPLQGSQMMYADPQNGNTAPMRLDLIAEALESAGSAGKNAAEAVGTSSIEARAELSRYVMFKYSLPLEVEVHEGEVLYLPLYWFHHVSAGHERSISVNFFYNAERKKKKTWEKLFCGYRSDAAYKCR